MWAVRADVSSPLLFENGVFLVTYNQSDSAMLCAPSRFAPDRNRRSVFVEISEKRGRERYQDDESHPDQIEPRERPIHAGYVHEDAVMDLPKRTNDQEAYGERS